MKFRKLKLLFLLFAFAMLLTYYHAKAQIPDGSTAPDFTFTDINGVSQNLYTYLNQGKWVALDVSATWCDPCWNYTNKGALDSLYNIHDDAGDKTGKIMFLESDYTTDSADLYGTGGNTRGNWVKGHNYIIMNPLGGQALRDFANNYAIPYYPTLLLICPDKKVYHDTLSKGTRATLSTWEYLAKTACTGAGLRLGDQHDNTKILISPNPVHNELHISINLSEASDLKLSLFNCLGQLKNEKSYIGNTGPNQLAINTTALSTGFYTLLVTGNTGIQTALKFVKY